MVACLADPEGCLGFLQHLAGHTLLAALRWELGICEGPAPGKPLEARCCLECSLTRCKILITQERTAGQLAAPLLRRRSLKVQTQQAASPQQRGSDREC